MQLERYERLGLKHTLPAKPFVEEAGRGSSIVLGEDSMMDSMTSSQFI